MEECEGRQSASKSSKENQIVEIFMKIILEPNGYSLIHTVNINGQNLLTKMQIGRMDYKTGPI